MHLILDYVAWLWYLKQLEVNGRLKSLRPRDVSCHRDKVEVEDVLSQCRIILDDRRELLLNIVVLQKKS